MKFVSIDTADAVIALMASLPEAVAVDTEYTHADPLAKGVPDSRKAVLTTIVLSTDGEVAYSIQAKFIGHLGPLKTRSMLYLQNFKADYEILGRYGLDLMHTPFRDTMLLHHLIDENAPHGLGDMVNSAFGDNYKEEFWAQYKSTDTAPKEAALEYECKDAIYTYRLAETYLEYLKEKPDLVEHVHRLALALYYTERGGLPIDEPLVNHTKIEMGGEIDLCLPAMRQDFLPQVEDWEMQAWLKAMAKLKTPKGKANVKKPVFNFGSDAQVSWLVYQALELPVLKRTKRTPKGGGNNPSVDYEALELLEAEGHTLGALKRYKELKNLYGTFVLGLLERIEDGRIYPEFNINGTVTGRISHCLARGQKVTVPGGYKNIEDIQPGDVVYTFTDDNKPTLSRVLAKMKNGVRECVEVKWQSSGQGDVGSLICTPDHRLKDKYLGWVRADALTRGDKLVHLRRSLQSNGRQRLYSTNKFMELEEGVIKREWFQATNQHHIHHKNHDKSDNHLDNLEILTAKEHTSHHSKERYLENPKQLEEARRKPKSTTYRLETNPRWIHLSKFSALRLLAMAGGRPTYINMDFNTFKRKCLSLNINIPSVAARYTKQGKYLKRSAIMSALEKGTAQACRELGVGVSRLKNACVVYGLAYNHQVLSVKPVGMREVYDLEIEGTHNFVVNEICVHNSNPNMANLPQDGPFRNFFLPSAGMSIFGSDYAQLEVIVEANLTRDPNTLRIISEGASKHDITAQELKIPRELAKTINFAAGYRCSPFRFQKILGCSLKEAEFLWNKYWETYSGVRALQQYCDDLIAQGKPIVTQFGRERHFPKSFANERDLARAQRQGYNALIQGTGADCMNRSYYLANERMLKNRTGRMLISVHDEGVGECPTALVEQEKASLVSDMESLTQYLGFDIPLKAKAYGPLDKWSKC